MYRPMQPSVPRKAPALTGGTVLRGPAVSTSHLSPCTACAGDLWVRHGYRAALHPQLAWGEVLGRKGWVALSLQGGAVLSPWV